MTDRTRRIEEIVSRLADLPPEERAAALDKECGDDLELRKALQEWLVTLCLVPSDSAEDSELTGLEIGPYKLIEKLGEGGFGIVYRAHQTDPVRREVAVKVLKPGMDSRAILRRFETERQALAMMAHPCIATVFDAGETAQGRPYFVMEYVRGVSITDHCDRERLTIRDRMELFIRVCEGVQHAHQKAIIHRDLTPSNILVSIQNGKAVVKIIDFGVAKATAQPLTEKTTYTKLGQPIGTPEYMSPEQATGNRGYRHAD